MSAISPGLVDESAAHTSAGFIDATFSRACKSCVVPFARFFASGVMRPVFLPDGSLLIGQTGRGWGAWGGQQASLQRLPVGLAVSLLATAPLMALPLSRLEGDHPGWPGVLAGGLGFVGVLMLVSAAQG